MNSRKCEICNVDVHRASFVKHLRSKERLDNKKLNELIIPEWLFKEPHTNKTSNLYNPKSLKQLLREITKFDDKQLRNELVKKMSNP